MYSSQSTATRDDASSSSSGPAPGKRSLTSSLPAKTGARTDSAGAPPELLARVGAVFLHTDDTSGARSYRISAGGGFVLTAAFDGRGVGTEFRADNKFRPAWDTLAAYVVAHQDSIAPTVRTAAAAATPDAAGPTADPWSFEGIAAAVGDGLTRAGDAVQGAIDRGTALISEGVAMIDELIGTVAPAAPGERKAADGTDDAAETKEPTARAAPAKASGPARQPTTTALAGSVGEGGANQLDDVVLVQDRLRQNGYDVVATGTMDPATIQAIGQYQAANVAHSAVQGSNTNLARLVDSLISKGGGTEASLLGGSPRRYKPLASGGVKENKKAKDAAAATGDARDHWDKILSVWAALSPHLPDGSHMTSGFRTSADQIRIINNFFHNGGDGAYKEEIIARHGAAAWQELDGKTDSESVLTKLAWVRECGQTVASPGGSPHEAGRALDVGGGTSDPDQIEALLRYRAEVDASMVTKILWETNGCVHMEFTP